MNDTFRDHIALMGMQFNCFVPLQIQDELALKREEELIFFIMLVPMILAVEYPKPYNRLVDLT